MSAELMIKAFEIAKSDKRLTPADKLVFMRWAWTTPDGATPAKIPIRPYARELGLDKSTVDRSVQRLKKYGYILVVSVEVVAGPMFQTSEKSGQSEQKPPSAKSVQGVRKKRTKRTQNADTNNKKKNNSAHDARDTRDPAYYKLFDQYLKAGTLQSFDEWRKENDHS